MSARAVAELVGAKLVYGDGALALHDVAALGTAGPGDMSFARGCSHLQGLDTLQAGLCFCTPELVEPLKSLGVRTIAECAHPGAAFVKAASQLVTPIMAMRATQGGKTQANLAKNIVIAPGAVIDDSVVIGENTVIGPGAVIGPGCVIGCDCMIGAGAVIGFTLMGDHVDVRPGAVIGEAGLGTVDGSNGLVAMAHFGAVRLEDDVRIGANATIDRAVFGETHIGARTKLDNLVQIAHNVTIGSDCVLASFCGVAGSSTLGNDVLMGGRAGIADHVNIGHHVRIAAASAVMQDIPEGETWGGHPARPLRAFLREQVAIRKLAGKKGGNDDAER